MSAQLTRIHTLAACRKAVLPATLAVLMGAPALAPAAWNWGLAGPKIYWAEVTTRPARRLFANGG